MRSIILFFCGLVFFLSFFSAFGKGATTAQDTKSLDTSVQGDIVCSVNVLQFNQLNLGPCENKVGVNNEKYKQFNSDSATNWKVILRDRKGKVLESKNLNFVHKPKIGGEAGRDESIVHFRNSQYAYETELFFKDISKGRMLIHRIGYENSEIFGGKSIYGERFNVSGTAVDGGKFSSHGTYVFDSHRESSETQPTGEYLIEVRNYIGNLLASARYWAHGEIHEGRKSRPVNSVKALSFDLPFTEDVYVIDIFFDKPVGVKKLVGQINLPAELISEQLKRFGWDTAWGVPKEKVELFEGVVGAIRSNILDNNFELARKNIEKTLLPMIKNTLHKSDEIGSNLETAEKALTREVLRTLAILKRAEEIKLTEPKKKRTGKNIDFGIEIVATINDSGGNQKLVASQRVSSDIYDEKFSNKPNFRVVSQTSEGKIIEERKLEFVEHVEGDTCNLRDRAKCPQPEKYKAFYIGMKFSPDIKKILLYHGEKLIIQTNVVQL